MRDLDDVYELAEERLYDRLSEELEREPTDQEFEVFCNRFLQGEVESYYSYMCNYLHEQAEGER